jgi:hypothetical protein
MSGHGITTEIENQVAYEHAVQRFREARIVLPTFAELAEPARIAPGVRAALAGVDPDAADPRNLFRVHWYNDAARTGTAAVPEHVVLPEALTGVPAKIVVALGDRFPDRKSTRLNSSHSLFAI